MTLRLYDPVETKSKARGIGIGEDERIAAWDEAANRDPVAGGEQSGSLDTVAPVRGRPDGESKLAVCQVDHICQRRRGHHVDHADHSEGGVAINSAEIRICAGCGEGVRTAHRNKITATNLLGTSARDRVVDEISVGVSPNHRIPFGEGDAAGSK